MATTKEDLGRWFDVGVQEGATHMIVVCDSFSYDDYPVYVKPSENVRAKYQEYLDGKHSMQRVMEIYSLKKPKGPQFEQRRAFEFD
jgi:phosphopantetheine adenylyltransferase